MWETIIIMYIQSIRLPSTTASKRIIYDLVRGACGELPPQGMHVSAFINTYSWFLHVCKIERLFYACRRVCQMMQLSLECRPCSVYGLSCIPCLFSQGWNEHFSWHSSNSLPFFAKWLKTHFFSVNLKTARQSIPSFWNAWLYCWASISNKRQRCIQLLVLS